MRAGLRPGSGEASVCVRLLEELLREDVPSDTGAQQRTTLSSKKRFFDPRTFGEGEDGKQVPNFESNPTGQLVPKPVSGFDSLMNEVFIKFIKVRLPKMEVLRVYKWDHQGLTGQLVGFQC